MYILVIIFFNIFNIFMEIKEFVILFFCIIENVFFKEIYIIDFFYLSLVIVKVYETIIRVFLSLFLCNYKVFFLKVLKFFL